MSKNLKNINKIKNTQKKINNDTKSQTKNNKENKGISTNTNNKNNNIIKPELKEEKDKKKEIEKENNNENKTTEITRIKAPRQVKSPVMEISNASNEEESSAQLEDVSEVNTIYNMKKNTLQASTTKTLNDKKSNIDSDNVIEEVDDFSKNIVKGSVYNLTKDKILLPYIYKLSLYNNSIINKTLNVLKNCNGKLFKIINSENYVRILEKNQKIVGAYQIYCLFSFFTNGKEFYKLKYAFNKWKKFLKIFNQMTKIKHIKNCRGHCLGCDCEDISECHISFCSCKNKRHDNDCNSYSLCFNCSCKLCQIMLKKILIRNIFMKKDSPKRYFLYIWYKNIFSKSRSINL